MSSQRHTGLTTSAEGSVTEPSLSTVHLRPSGMVIFQSSRCAPMYWAVVPKNFAMTSAVRWRPRPVVSISMPNVCVLMVCLLSVRGVSRSWCTHTSLCVHEIATRPMHQLSGAEITLIRQRDGQESGIFLYARREMRLNSAFLARSMRITVSASPGDGPITLHTPPTFTGCFHAECCPSKPSCTKKRGFYAPYTPVNATVFRLYALFAPEYSQTLPATARIRSES